MKVKIKNAKPAAEVLAKRIKKQARREKQRAGNLDRALAMRKIRKSYISTINAPRRTIDKLQVGCSGWFYWHWRGKFYPEDKPTKDWFAHYAKKFTTVELNAPFYAWPTVATVKTWLREGKEHNITYTVKVSELITHVKKFSGTKTLVKDFGFIADILGPYMGCFLFQLPPSFKYTAGRLKSILAQLDPQHKNVVEFRHDSWWNEKVYAAFQKAGHIFCSCSAPRLPDDLIKTADDIYIRFHGKSAWYKHNYAKAELDHWAEKIKQSKAKNIWVYFNNDYQAHAIKNSQQLKKLLSKKSSD